MIEYVNPEGQSSIENTPYRLSASIKGANAIKIGFLANGFPDSDIFIAKVGEVIGERLPAAELRYWNKGNAGLPANDAILGEIADCDVAIAAYGH